MRIALLTSATPSPQAAAVNAPCAAQPAADSTSYLVRPATRVHVDVSPLARRAGVPERCDEPDLPCTTTLLLSTIVLLPAGWGGPLRRCGPRARRHVYPRGGKDARGTSSQVVGSG